MPFYTADETAHHNTPHTSHAYYYYTMNTLALKISILMCYEKKKLGKKQENHWAGPPHVFFLRVDLCTKPLNNVFNVANIAYMWSFYLAGLGGGSPTILQGWSVGSEGRIKQVPGKKNPA